MNQTTYDSLAFALAAAVLLSMGLLMHGRSDAHPAGARGNDSPADPDLQVMQVTGALVAPEAEPEPPPRQRSALSMPYFSFAQMLRPRSYP